MAQPTPFVLLLAVLTMTTALPLASCGGQNTASTGEKEAREGEEVAEVAPVESLPSSEPGPNMDTEVCQTGEALEVLGPDGLQQLTDVLSEEVSAGRFANMQEAMASRGYTCNGQIG